MTATVTIFAESCKGVEDCGLCMEVCPVGLFAPADTPNARGYIPAALTDAAACTGCGRCMRTCPDFALVVERIKEKEVSHG